MDSELASFLAEQFGEINRRFDAVDQRFEVMDRKIDEKFEEAKRHFGVLAERLESKVERLAEGVRGFDRQFQGHCRQSEAAHGEIISLVRLTYRDLRRRVR